LQRVDLSFKDASLVFSFVCILVIACKDKDKKSHPPRAWHEFPVFVKKCSELKFENKATKLKSFEIHQFRGFL